MVRKGLIICAVTFVRDPLLRTYVCIWILLIFLALQWVYQPFEAQLANKLETASLSILSASLNISLLWHYPQFNVGTSCARACLTGLVSCLTCLVPRLTRPFIA